MGNSVILDTHNMVLAVKEFFDNTASPVVREYLGLKERLNTLLEDQTERNKIVNPIVRELVEQLSSQAELNVL